MKCPHCGSSRIIKAGKTERKYVTRQGYRCKGCKRYFVERAGSEGRHYPGKVISQVLYLYVAGLSLFRIREFMWQNFGYRPSDSTILDWVKSYSELVKQFERGRAHKPRVKGRIQLDEVQLKVGKNVLQHEPCGLAHEIQPRAKNTSPRRNGSS